MLEEIERLMDENPELPYVKALRDIEMTDISRAVITHMSRHLVLSGTTSIPMNHLVFLLDSQHQKYDFDRMMSEGKHFLMREGWVENAFSEGFKDKEEYQLTPKAREVLLKDYDIKPGENKGCDVMQSDKITMKQLFFADNVESQLDSLSELLSE